MSLSLFHQIWILLVTAAVISCIILEPKLKIPKTKIKVIFDYGLAPILGVILLLCSTTITFSTVGTGILGNAQTIIPWQIVIIFFTLGYICISWDVTGVFEYAALKTLAAAGSSGRRVLVYIFLLTTILTLISSNDIVTMTLTPIIAVFTQVTAVDPVPFIFAQFLAANVWSATLLIGNTTNIIISQGFKIGFAQYSAWMTIPTIFSGITCLGAIFIYFYKRTPQKIEIVNPKKPELKDKVGAIYGLIVLILSRIFMGIGGYIGAELFVTCLVACGFMLIWDFVRDLIYFKTKIIFQLKYLFYDIKKGETEETEIKPQDIEDLPAEKLSSETSENSSGTLSEDPEESELQKEVPSSIEVIEQNPTIPKETSSPIESVDINSNDSFSIELVEQVSSESKETPISLEVVEENSEEEKISTVVLVIRRLPWKTLPFVLCMFIIVEGFEETGWNDIFARALVKLFINPTAAIFSIGVLSSLVCNVLNNQPMTILFTRILQNKQFSSLSLATQQGALLGLVLGSNFGANLTLVGALAGIMWSKILKNKGVKVVTFLQFMKVGFIITPWVIIVACSTIAVEDYIVYK